jgi:hypothetical protein
LEESSPRSRNQADQRRLWQISEELTGVSYRIMAPPGAAA